MSSEHGSAPAGTSALDRTVVGDRRLPDFFIVGHAKCGTTALYDMLRQHPRIYMPDHKEPWFFARSNPHPQTSGERSIAFTGRRMETLDDYLALFTNAKADQLLGDPGADRHAGARSGAGATVLGVSPDPVKAVHKFHKRQGLNFTLLADEDHQAAELGRGEGEMKQAIGLQQLAARDDRRNHRRLGRGKELADSREQEIDRKKQRQR